MIEVKNIKKYFSKPYKEPGLKGALKTLFTHKKVITKAVDDISFTINDGEIVGYIGSNGAGKSTTIKMMSGILTPTSGDILFDGVKPYAHKSRAKLLKDIGVVFGQRTQLWWDLPLKDSFDLYKEIYEIPKDVYERRMNYLKELLGLDSFIMSQVKTLSLGQRMRADLAAALIHNPKVLFLDEPTIGLDVLVKEKITKAILDINAKFNTTIILTTHDMKDIKSLCDRVIIIDEGHMLYDGSIENITKKFGDIRHVFVLPVDGLEINIESLQFLAGKDVNVTLLKDGYIEVTYDKDKKDAGEVFSFITSNIKFKDLRVDETSLNTIVKKIYEEKSV